MNARFLSLAVLTTLAPSLAAQTWSSTPAQLPARALAGATSAGGKAFFAGGGHPFVGYHDEVNIYDSTVGPPTDPTAWSTATLSQARANLAAVGVGGKVLFAGGNHLGFDEPASSVVDIYDVATGTWSQSALSQPRWGDAATSVAGYALFGCGVPDLYGDFPCDVASPSPRVDVYEAATGAWSEATLAVPRIHVKATSVGPYAFFAGGQLCAFGPASDAVEVYDSTLGAPSDPAAWSVVTLSRPRALGAAVSAGGKAFFAGGSAEVAPDVWDAVATVDVYDSCVGPPSDPAAWSVELLSAPRQLLTATAQEPEVLFAGGTDASFVYTDTVDVFDTGTGVWSVESLSVPRLPISATAGDYALFAGGEDEDWVWDPYDVVDARQQGQGHWYVDIAAAGPGDGSFEDPFTAIQDGIDAAQPGDTVHVEPGQYAEHLAVTKDLTLRSRCGRAVTTLTRDFVTSAPLITSTNADLVLDGFTLWLGQAAQGGGLLVSGGAVLVEDSRFYRCRAGHSMSSPGEGGAIKVASGQLEVVRTIFDQNTAYTKGGAIYGSATVRHCEFQGNDIEGNTPGFGGGAIYGNPRIENSAFYDNAGGHSIHPLPGGDPIEIYDSTFFSTFNGSGSYALLSNSVVRNSIFWACCNQGVFIGGPGQTPDIQYSIVKGGYPGVGNLDQSPGFVGQFAGIDGLRLRPTSPAIDAGSNADVPAGSSTDVAGDPRIRHGRAFVAPGATPTVDIGAFEFQPRRGRVGGLRGSVAY